MGNICNWKEDGTIYHVEQQKQKSYKSSITDEHENIGSANSDIHAKDLSFATKNYKYENSFNRNNEIGPYFCGGSIQEKDAMSYQQRIQEFEGIMKKSEQHNKKKVSKRDEKSDSATMNKDMERTFTKKFKELPILSVNPKVLQKCIKKGPPIKYRWVSWKSHLYSISQLNVEATTELYKQFQYNSKEEGQIEKDINRTFPSHKYFATNITKNSMRDNDTINGYEPLKKVLVSISNMYPELGYCQGMNFILGFILMIDGANEPEAFWTFKVLAEHPDFMIMGLYENGLPFLKLLEYLAKKVLKENCRELMDYFEELDIPDSFWLTKWILTLFLYNFPVKICSRFWDYLITNDIFSIIKLFIPLLEIFKKEFMSNKDACDFMESFTQLTQVESNLTDPKSEFYLNVTEIIKKADSYKIEKKTIAKYSHQYLLHQESDNEYAKLYSLYDNTREFKAYHHKLIQAKVKSPELPSVMEDKNEESSSNKQDVMLKKSIVDGTDTSITNCNSKIQTDKESQDITIKISDKTNDEGQICNLNTTLDLISKPSQYKLDQTDSKITQNDVIIERPKSQLKNMKQIEENPESSSFNNNINEEEGEEYDDSDDSDEYEEQVDPNLSMKKSDSDRKYTKSKTMMHEHKEAITFDRESYNMFQSLLNKSIDIPIIKKSSIGFNKSIDTDGQFEGIEVEEEEIYSTTLTRTHIIQNKTNYAQSSAFSSQYDLSKTDKIEIPQNNRMGKKQEFCGSTISDEKTIQSEIKKYQMS